MKNVNTYYYYFAPPKISIEYIKNPIVRNLLHYDIYFYDILLNSQIVLIRLF